MPNSQLWMNIGLLLTFMILYSFTVSLVLFLVASCTKILFYLSVHIIRVQRLMLSSVTLRCICWGIMTHLSVCRIYSITLKLWQTDPMGQFCYIHACVCVPTADLLIDHRSVACLLWAFMLGGINSLCSPLAPSQCLQQNGSTSSAQMHEYVALNGLAYAHKYYKLFLFKC